MKRASSFLLFIIAAAVVSLPVAASAQGEYGAVQFPSNTATQVGVPTENIYGRYYREGVTEGPGQGPDVEAELGYGPDDGLHPTNNLAAWTWIPAVYKGDLGGNDDEYRARIVPPLPGSFDYAYRFRYQGGEWLYADMYPDGTEGGYSVPGDLLVELEEECLKWTQPPDCESGVDLPTYRIDPEQDEPLTRYLVADDWVCDGRPITHVRWWGSYPGYWTNGLAGFPPTDPTAGRPLGFRLTWYTDIPAEQSGTGYSMPGEVIESLFAPLGPWQDPQPGQVVETYYCTVPREVPPGFEDEYLYDFVLPEPWNEKEDNIYWLSIEAVFTEGYEPEDPPPSADRTEFPEWGWKTTFETNLIDDAVVWVNLGGSGGPPVWRELAWPEFPWPGLFNPPYETPANYQQFTNHPPDAPSVNMAFELFTDICPRRDTKWSQMPDMEDGTDLWSWHVPDGEQNPGSPVVRADDFFSDGRLISDIHWWGSYSNWMYWTNGTFADPIDPPHDPILRPMGFILSWHKDDGACLPGEELRNIFVPIDQCHEMFYGTVTQRWVEPQPYYEHEYQYYVDLMTLEGPWPEEPGEHYWLNIDAVFTNGFVPSPEQYEHGGWGWKIAKLPPDETQIHCPPAISNRVGGMGWQPDPGSLPPGHPRLVAGQPYDLAFELTTHQVDTNGVIAITNIAVTSISTGHVVKSVGTSGAGRQYLQNSTNLMTNVWVDVPGQVKIAPYPPPWWNTWTLPGPVTTTNTFYRVIER